MAITNLNQAIAGFQQPQYYVKAATATSVIGRPQSFWNVGGCPGAGTFNGSLSGGTYSSTSGIVQGQIPHFDPVSGNSYLARFSGILSNPGVLLLLDRLWDNGGITITSNTAQTVNSVSWPARDVNGATAGYGVLLGVEVQSAVGAATPTITISYTNSANIAGRTSTNQDATQSAATAGAFYRMSLQSGDFGVQSVQSITLSASWVSGTINIVAYRLLAVLELNNANIGGVLDPLTGGFPQLWNGTVPFLVAISNAAAGLTVSGGYTETQG